jgi:hypothetical protein
MKTKQFFVRQHTFAFLFSQKLLWSSFLLHDELSSSFLFFERTGNKKNFSTRAKKTFTKNVAKQLQIFQKEKNKKSDDNFC